MGDGITQYPIILGVVQRKLRINQFWVKITKRFNNFIKLTYAISGINRKNISQPKEFLRTVLHFLNILKIEYFRYFYCFYIYKDTTLKSSYLLRPKSAL